MKIKNIHIFGGGTVSHIANHFAVCAPAYGSTAKRLAEIISFDKRYDNMRVNLELTRMAGGKLETNEDVANRIDELKAESRTKIIFFNCALVDWEPNVLSMTNENKYDSRLKFGKYVSRLETRNLTSINLSLTPSEKIIPNIRTGRKDIFLVGFKTTCNSTEDVMYQKGLRLLKDGHVNLVLVNDTKTRLNMIVVPEEATYSVTTNREDALKELLDITWYRSQMSFVQSNVVSGTPVSWMSTEIPFSLRTVIDYAIKKGAYRPFGENKACSGHFAVKLSDIEFLTTIRKSNLSDIENVGLVRIKTDSPDTITAFGAKPSVGGQSQRNVFKDHVGFDCIFHAHVELKIDRTDSIPIASQRNFTCGSLECAINTSNNMKEFESGKIKAVMLDNHGPNIIFNKNIDPQLVINFIDRNWNLNTKTGGYQI